MADEDKKTTLTCGCVIWVDVPQPTLRYCHKHATSDDMLRMLKHVDAYLDVDKKVDEIEIEEIPMEFLIELKSVITRAERTG